MGLRSEPTTPAQALIAILMLLMLVALPARGAEQDASTEAQNQDQRATLLAEIASEKEQIESLEARADQLDGLMAEIVEERLDLLWTSVLANTIAVAKDILKQEAAQGADANVTTPEIRTEVIEDLKILPGIARDAMSRLRTRVEFPSPDMAPAEFVVADQRLLKYQKRLDKIFRVFIDYVEIGEAFDLETQEEREALVAAVSDSGANRSAFLHLAITNAELLRPAVATLPDDTGLASELGAAEARVDLASATLLDAVDLMNRLGLESTHYRQQVLEVTGELTTDVLDVGVFSRLISEWGQNIGALIADEGMQLLFQLLVAMVIVFFAYQLARLAQNLVERGLQAASLNISSLLRRMIISSARNLVMIFGVLIAISQLGISLGPLLAGLGIAGFIVGFALQDTLGNFASGILILLYRPFDVGDIVEAGGVTGEVSHMSLVNTTFMTFDNQRLVVPNNQIWGSVIRNVTAQTTRRVDLVFGVSYEADLDRTEEVLREVVDACPTVLKDPEPNIRVHELADSSVNFIVRPWVNTSDYWDTYWNLTKAVKQRFDKEGIAIPFPQRDVHFFNQG